MVGRGWQDSACLGSQDCWNGASPAAQPAAALQQLPLSWQAQGGSETAEPRGSVCQKEIIELGLSCHEIAVSQRRPFLPFLL